jgi:hypothetical protein
VESIEAPSSCYNDLDYVHRVTSGATLRYRWSEGQENEYELVFQHGSPTYFRAIGYVSRFCEVNTYYDGSYYGFGTIVFGTPVDIDDGTECSICDNLLEGDLDPELPACEPCSDPMQDELNQESLADFCAFHRCPATIAEASALVAANCPSVPDAADATLSTGCGYTRVAWTHASGFEAYFFDSQSEALVGAELTGDLPEGACYTTAYAGGDVPTQACADASTCTLCDSASGAAGSGSGAAGSTATGTPPLPRCP